MTRGRVALFVALLVGCGSVPTSEGDVAYLEVAPPLSLIIQVGDSLQFHAKALDQSGAELPDVVVRWRTPDETVSVDSSGKVKGLSDGKGRVQAFIGNGNSRNFVSDFYEITVNPVAGTAPR